MSFKNETTPTIQSSDEPHYSRLKSKLPPPRAAISVTVLILVSHVDITWNSFLPYLVSLTDQLESLGFRYIDDDVVVSKEEK